MIQQPAPLELLVAAEQVVSVADVIAREQVCCALRLASALTVTTRLLTRLSGQKMNLMVMSMRLTKVDFTLTIH